MGSTRTAWKRTAEKSDLWRESLGSWRQRHENKFKCTMLRFFINEPRLRFKLYQKWHGSWDTIFSASSNLFFTLNLTIHFIWKICFRDSSLNVWYTFFLIYPFFIGWNWLKMTIFGPTSYSMFFFFLIL